MKRKMMKMATALVLSGCMALTGPMSAMAAQENTVQPTTVGLTTADSEETEFDITRLAGDTRYDTAIQSADELKTILGVTKFSSVVLASGVNFPDALAGSSLAAQKDAPILLVGSNDANKGQAAGTALTVSYIQKNLTAGGTVYILGGTSAVSAKTEETLTAAGFQVVRLAGDNRYETDLAIINEMEIEEGTDVVVVRGYTSYKTDADKKKKTNPQGYADSLSVSGVAGAEGMPIFLADSKGLTADQLDKISDISPENIYVIGGTSAVSDAIYSSLEDLGCGYVKRLSGDDRYATSTAIAEEFGLYNSDSAVIAYGQNFPDGLTGGVLAAKLGAPLLLTEKGKTTAANTFLKSSLIRSLYVLGGTAVLSDDTIDSLTNGVDLSGSETEILHSGKDGDLDWSIDSNGLLTVTGTGDYTLTLVFGNGWGPEWTYYYDEIKAAKINVKNINYTGYMFSHCNLVSVDLSGLDTSHVNSMHCMFNGCKKLTSLDLSSFDTSNVTDMSWMFSDCNSLTSLDLSSFDTSNVTDMSWMFSGCNSLTSLNVSSFDTSNVTDIHAMFNECESLTSLDVNSFDTSNVYDMRNMFSFCKKLTSLDLSSFNTSNVENMDNMFWGCEGLTSLDLSTFDTSKVISTGYMFTNCVNLTSLNLSTFDTSNFYSIALMFSGCSSLTTSITLTGDFTNYEACFYNAATASDAAIYVSYSGNCTKEMAQAIVDTKSENSHVYLVD